MAYGSAVLFTATTPGRCNGYGDLPRRHGSLRYGNAISGGVATQLTNSLPARHTFDHGAVAWRGYQLCNSAVSTAVSQIVTMASSTVALVSPSPNPSTFGAGVTCLRLHFRQMPRAQQDAFLDGATLLGTGTITSGVATLTISSLAGGTHSITAQYGGDTNYSGSVSTPISQVVNPVCPAPLPWSLRPNPSTFGSNVTLTATVTVGGYRERDVP